MQARKKKAAGARVCTVLVTAPPLSQHQRPWETVSHCGKGLTCDTNSSADKALGLVAQVATSPENVGKRAGLELVQIPLRKGDERSEPVILK